VAERSDGVSREENGGAGRFLLRTGGGIVGTLDFTRPRPSVLQIDFVEVKPSARGAGLGRQLVEAAVQWARDEKLMVVPRCSYARALIEGDASLRTAIYPRR
jgi:predicted GNAT family acetyltransferase